MATKSTKPVRKAKVEQRPFSVHTTIDVPLDDPTRDTVTDSVRAFLAQGVRRHQLAASAEFYNRTEGMIDVLMVDGEGQWDAGIVADRQADKRPCLSINRFAPNIAYMASEQQQMRVGIKVNPVGGGADPDGAIIRQGLIRHIENQSHAEAVYDAAFQAMLEKGWSWIRVTSDYEAEDSFHQALKIEGFVNDFCVYADPTAKHPTRRDMDWAFVIDDIPVGEYKSLYPNSKIESLSNFRSIGDDAPGWYTTQYVRVAEYYYADYEDAQLVQLVDGTGRWKDELTGIEGIFYDTKTGLEVPVNFGDDGKPVERKSRRRTIKWAKINACEILEGNDDLTEGIDLKAQWIPLIMVCGRQRNIQGQTRLSGMIRNNRDAQRMYNYAISALIEAVALAPKAPYIAAAGQIEQYKAIWDQANTKNWPYLPYDPITKDMQPVPAPQRQQFEPAIQALFMVIRQFDQDLKTGFFIDDAAMGRRGAQESGKAIELRKGQSEAANSGWMDNLSKSIQHIGEVILDLLPTRYDAKRTITIVRPDNEQAELAINELFHDDLGRPNHLNDMTHGKYSCVVTAGLTNVTQRQEMVERMFGLMQADPAVTSLILDIVVEHMDFPGKELLVARLKKALPPQLQDSKEGEGGGPSPEQAAEALQMVEVLGKQLEELQGQLESKQMEIDRKAEIEMAKIQAGTQTETMKLRGEAAKLKLEQDRLDLQWRIAQLQDRTERLTNAAEIESKEEIAKVNAKAAAARSAATPKKKTVAKK